MNTKKHPLKALLFGLKEDLAGELQAPLELLCSQVSRTSDCETYQSVVESGAQVIFCSTDLRTVSRLRTIKPFASIVVVSRYPEVEGWLDSIEAGANDYCAAPFESSQLTWILETSVRSAQLAA